MDFALSEDQLAIRDAIRELCSKFPGSYWRDLEERREYPSEFVDTLTSLGWLSILIPTEYGGGGLGVTEAAIVLEEIHRSGGNANACHAQMYTMGALLRHGSEEQKRRYLPEIAAGRLRLQAFGVTEPDAGSDTTRISTRAERRGDTYVISGQKVFISRVDQSDLMLLLARTTPLKDVEQRTDGLSLFLVDLREARRAGTIETHRIPVMFNHHTYQVFLSDLEVPAENLIGAEGQGFRLIIDGWNAERCLIASEAIGDGRFLVERASEYASRRVVFGRPVGANQGVAFPLAQAFAALEAASLLRFKATTLFDAGAPAGIEANAAKLLASQASVQAANAAMLAFGGNGFATEYDVERKYRETKLLEIAPVNNNLVLAFLAQRALGLPRSY
ncbi:MAG TPA: acyl-CoA dehydrogenase family protein [Acidimicrobiales bacterium]|jgi:acyl-CoA dehydrogenase|nr:acyl-CoA dehydrogenase family protein [Acidimicrobiales bacterium]